MKFSIYHRLLRLSPALLTGVAIALAPLPAIAQRISNPSPSQGATDVEPTSSISATFTPADGLTVDPASVAVFVDDAEVTAESVITADFFSYRPSTAFTPGTHSVRIVFTNSQGQQRSGSWNFVVGNATATEIESVSHNGNDAPLAVGETLLVTVTGTPGSDVTVFLVQDGDSLQSLPAEEISSGVYVADKAIANTDLASENIVVARLSRATDIRFATAEQPLETVAAVDEQVDLETTAEGEETGGDVETAAAEAPVALNPVVTSHQNGDRVSGNSFTIAGTTRPGASVRVVATAENSIGGFISAQRTLADRTITADANGEFSLAVSPGIVAGGSVYDISITASDAGETSPTTTLELVQE